MDEGDGVKLVTWGFGALALATLPAATHAAGDIPEHELTRIPVSDRPRPEFDPIGYHLGSVFFYPRLTAGVRYNSNVFASPHPRADASLVFSPQLLIRSDPLRFSFSPHAPWLPYGDRPPSSFELKLGADIYRFREFNSENRVDANARFRGHTEIGHDLTFDTTLDAARKHETRGNSTSPSNAARPIPYNDFRADASFTKTFNRFGVQVGGAARRLDYENVNAVDGTLLDQSSRNGTIFTAFVRPFYEFSPGYRAFFRAQANTRNYEATGTFDRDSSGYDLQGGIDFLVTPLITGTIGAGYLSQNYENPRIAQVDGPAFFGKVTWLATALTSLTFRAERTIAETVAPGFEGQLETSFSARIDHELMRNLILYSEAKYVREDFIGAVRRDNYLRLSAGADYVMNRAIRFGVRYDYIDRESTLPSFTFDNHVVMFNVTAQH